MDFANATTTDAAITNLFKNLKEVYKLSGNYLVESKKNFPLMSSMYELSDEKISYVENIISVAELSAEIFLYMEQTYYFILKKIDLDNSYIELLDYKEINQNYKNFKYSNQDYTIKGC